MVGVAGLLLFVVAPLSLGGQQLISGNQEVLAFGLFMALPLLWSLSTVYNSMFIGEGNSLKAQYPALVEALARLPFLFYVAYHDFSILGMTLAYVVGAAASALYSLPAVYKRMRRFRRGEAVRLFRFAWPLMASLLINYLVTNSVPLIVGISLGTKLLSVFLAANGFRILILSIPAAIATPLFPYLAGLHRQQKYEAIRQGTWQALRYSAMLLVPGVVALVTYRYNFLNVFYTSVLRLERRSRDGAPIGGGTPARAEPGHPIEHQCDRPPAARVVHHQHPGVRALCDGRVARPPLGSAVDPTRGRGRRHGHPQSRR